MQQNVGVPYLLEGAFECIHEAVRQLVDETHGIDQKGPRPTGQLQAADSGIERRKEFVLNKNIRLCQPVHERRLARVRVTHERNNRVWYRCPAHPVESTSTRDFAQTPAQCCETLAHAPAIDFELRLTGTTRTDAAAKA